MKFLFRFLSSITVAVSVFILATTGHAVASAAPPLRAETLESLAKIFSEPPDVYKPHVWWHWLGSNFTKEGMTKDLEAMKESGIAGVVVFNAPSWLDTKKNPWPEKTYRSEAYWDALGHAIKEARRLGMTLGIHNSPGWSTTGGPWITPDQGMQAVAYSKTSVSGARRIKIALPNPKSDDAQAAPYFKDVAVVAVPANPDVTAGEVLDLSANFSPEGVLEWNAPAGEWVIYRVGHAPTFVRSHPTPEDVAEKSLEVDKLNPDANRRHWDNVLNPFKERFASYIGSTFDSVWIDSYEAGYQNWSPNFRAEFIRRKSYDPVPRLVIADLRGEKILDAKNRGFRHPGRDASPETQRFYEDCKEVVSRLFLECIGIGKSKINAAGFQLCWEPYISWGGDLFDIREGTKLADVPVTEFWVHSGDVFAGETMIKAAAEGGRRILGAEAFTGMEATCRFTETPAMLKRSADMGYNYGVNRYYLHSWPHQPFGEEYQPGFGFAHYGTHFSRYQTWFEPGKAFFAYLARCQMLLQQGTFISRNSEVIHRRFPYADIFFVRNTNDAREMTLTFPVANRAPELWDAYAGAIKKTSRWKSENNKTSVTVHLEKNASIFVIFPQHPTRYVKQNENKVIGESVREITGPWPVVFRPKIGGENFSKTFPALVDYSKQNDPEIKYFSGTADYQKTVSFTRNDIAGKKRIVIDLGRVCDIAEIEINGKRVGVLWSAPYRTDITDFLKQGENTLKISITNNWTNRLIGDEQHPEDFEWKNQHLRAMKSLPEWFIKKQPRPVKERRTFAPWYYFNKNSPLYPAGLLGPTRIITQDIAANE
ncbi:MAG: hypothetical protein LBS59_00880 [Puniceicoccales bacterium]|jgi:hypothetical protein|nr:hypothetical protein [Puniceicoccales bacterium]